jgi:hypothetical protein
MSSTAVLATAERQSYLYIVEGRASRPSSTIEDATVRPTDRL